MRETRERAMTNNQRNVLIYVVKERFNGKLPKVKGSKEWGFHEYFDHGERNADVKCATCGIPLRHEFIVINKKTKEKMTLGSDHLVKKLSIPEPLADEVFQRIEYVKYVKQELINKYNNGFELNPYLKKHLGQIKVPKEIEKLLDADLPLLDEQISYLDRNITKALDKEKREEREKKMYIGGSEIKCPIVYKVATGEIDADEYFRSNYSNEILSLLSKHRYSYVVDYDIISHLVKNKGMPYEISHGQHVLLKPLRKHLNNQKGVQVGEDDYGHWHFMLR